MTNYLESLKKVAGNEYAAIVENVEDYSGDLDTGVYSLNALLSGSVYKGPPDNIIIALAGEEATGKTYFLISMIKTFLDSDPNAVVIFFESESAKNTEREQLIERGVDVTRVLLVPVVTIQEFRTQAIRIVDKHLETPEDKRPKIMMCLDSLGMLSTNKEVEDIGSGSDTRDMTRAQLIKGAFRVLTLRLGRAKIPMIITNHTYDTQGLFSKKTMSGGCLVSGTKIKTVGGDKNIEDVKIGDQVLTMFGFRNVLDTFEFDDKELYEIEFDDGVIVKCSSDHRFLIENDHGYTWVCAKDLVEGIELLTHS